MRPILSPTGVTNSPEDPTLPGLFQQALVALEVNGLLANVLQVSFTEHLLHLRWNGDRWQRWCELVQAMQYPIQMHAANIECLLHRLLNHARGVILKNSCTPRPSIVPQSPTVTLRSTRWTSRHFLAMALTWLATPTAR
jgi:hypothetical protein